MKLTIETDQNIKSVKLEIEFEGGSVTKTSQNFVTENSTTQNHVHSTPVESPKQFEEVKPVKREVKEIHQEDKPEERAPNIDSGMMDTTI